MTTLLLILALAAKFLGVVFLFAAALGVLRFADPFQRMHAATKAGTLGAGFVILGVVLELQRTDATLVGLCAILFLLLTIPISGHLLGRAAFVSGALAPGLDDDGALAAEIGRAKKPLEQRARRKP